MTSMDIPEERHLQGHSNRNVSINRAIMLNVPMPIVMKMYNWRDSGMVNDYLRGVYKSKNGAPNVVSKMPLDQREALIEHIF